MRHERLLSPPAKSDTSLRWLEAALFWFFSDRPWQAGVKHLARRLCEGRVTPVNKIHRTRNSRRCLTSDAYVEGPVIGLALLFQYLKSTKMQTESGVDGTEIFNFSLFKNLSSILRLGSELEDGRLHRSTIMTPRKLSRSNFMLEPLPFAAFSVWNPSQNYPNNRSCTVKRCLPSSWTASLDLWLLSVMKSMLIYNSVICPFK